MSLEHNNLFAGSLWAYRSVFKQTNAAGGAIKVDIAPSVADPYIILYLQTGNDNYSAARTIDFFVRDVDDDYVTSLGSGSADNQYVRIPATAKQSGGTTTLVNAWTDSSHPLGRIVFGTDYLAIELADAGAQNEELTVTLRALLRGDPPTISKARSTNAADVTITETYNAVIG